MQTIIQVAMEKHNFVTIADLTKEKILYMIKMAQEFEKHPNRELLKGKVVATLFFGTIHPHTPEFRNGNRLGSVPVSSVLPTPKSPAEQRAKHSRTPSSWSATMPT